MTREEAREALSVLKIYDAPWLREAVDMAIEALAEPKRGKWETVIRYEHYPSGREYEADYCSVCGRRGSLEYNYCPCCGTKMYKGGESDEVD